MIAVEDFELDGVLLQKQQMHLQETLDGLELEPGESLYGWFDIQRCHIENMEEPLRVSDEVMGLLKAAHPHSRVFRYTQEKPTSSKLEIWM